MLRKVKEYLEEGEFVVVIVKNIYFYGVFFMFDEYFGKEGFMYISEVVFIWVKNISDYFKEGQKIVVKVICVDFEKGYIDLSLKRVNQQQRKVKFQEYKRVQKVENLFKMVVEKFGKDFEMVWREVWVLFEEEYGEVYVVFEDVVQNGMDVFKGFISDEWIEVLKLIIEVYVEILMVMIDVEFEIIVLKFNGIEIIKEVFIKVCDRVNQEKDIEVKFFYQGVLRYRIDIIVLDYYKVEEVLEDIVEEIFCVIKEVGGEVMLIRKEKRIKKVKKRGF